MARLFLIALACVICLAPARADDPGAQATIAYAHGLQTNTGGFLAQAPAPEAPGTPTLRATSSAVRTLQYLMAPIPHKEACVKFVANCHDAQSGGFADLPGGKGDVFSTAVGLMAVKALGMPVAKYGPGAVKFLTENARSFEDIRSAAAGLESLPEKPNYRAWRDAVAKLQNSDGTTGTEAGQARATAGVAVTILRLGGTPKDKALILKVLKEGQRNNGGYGKGDNELASDLETTYRVMRCFMMLEARPNRVEGLRTFVAKCRNEDGGYGVSPGQPSSISGTYFATIIRFWLET